MRSVVKVLLQAGRGRAGACGFGEMALRNTEEAVLRDEQHRGEPPVSLAAASEALWGRQPDPEGTPSTQGCLCCQCSSGSHPLHLPGHQAISGPYALTVFATVSWSKDGFSARAGTIGPFTRNSELGPKNIFSFCPGRWTTVM